MEASRHASKSLLLYDEGMVQYAVRGFEYWFYLSPWGRRQCNGGRAKEKVVSCRLYICVGGLMTCGVQIRDEIRKDLVTSMVVGWKYE